MIREQLGRYIKRSIDLADEELEIILSHFKPLKAKKNEFLLSQGQTSQRTFFVGSGCLRIFFINAEGQDST